MLSCVLDDGVTSSFFELLILLLLTRLVQTSYWYTFRCLRTSVCIYKQQLAKMSIDLNFVELTADVLEIFFIK